MSDWKAARAALRESAEAGDVLAVRAQLATLLATEQTPRVFTLAAKLAEALVDHSSLRRVRLLVMRSYTVEPMIAPLKAFALERGLALDVDLADYDQFEQVLLSDGRKIEPEAVLLLARLEDYEPMLASGYGGLTSEQASELVGAASARPGGWLFDVKRRWNGASGILAGVSLPRLPSYGLADSSVELGHRKAVAQLNEHLRAGCRSSAGATFLDVDQVLGEIGTDNAFDDRMWAHAHQPYTMLALAAIAKRCARILAAQFTPRRKCIVLDCDNTLWGGVIGEDGIDGIALGPEYPGAAFVRFQKQLVALNQRGIILALASKNNEADVLEVFRDHRHQVLRLEHIAAHAIGWGDKATGIESLAAELNIGLDSIVFIDDSDYECALVRERLPMVEVITAPANPLELAPLAAQIESLDALEVSADDRKRGSMYKAQARRSRVELEAPSLEGFLRSLNLEISIDPVTTPAEVERAAQLCQRTNQLNATTRRHRVADIEGFAADPKASAQIVRLRDRYGDYGMCGLAITLHQDSLATVDTFLLSCRVIGRGVEDALAAAIENAAQEQGIAHIRAAFIPTAKNAPAATMFNRLGYGVIETTDERTVYEKSLTEGARALPNWFKVAT